MPGATTTFAIPYPLLTDRLTDGAASIQSTAEAVDRELGAVIVNRDQALTAIDTREAEAIADVNTARDLAVADVQAVSADAETINARIDDLTALYWIGAS